LKPIKFDARLVASSIPNCCHICVGLVKVKLHLIQTNFKIDDDVGLFVRLLYAGIQDAGIQAW